MDGWPFNLLLGWVGEVGLDTQMGRRCLHVLEADWRAPGRQGGNKQVTRAGGWGRPPPLPWQGTTRQLAAEGWMGLNGHCLRAAAPLHRLVSWHPQRCRTHPALILDQDRQRATQPLHELQAGAG